MNLATRRLSVKRTATGLGLFALTPIPANRKIVEYIGPIVSNAHVEASTGKYFFELDENRSIDGSSRSNIARYINHSCEPNAKGFTDGKKIWVWSLRATQAGEEITIDYGKDYMSTHIKRCRCESCP